jgi:hypothetical protein
MATELRRVRGYYDESNPSDMIEYHIVRDGVDEQAISDFLLSRFKDVRVIPYWSNQSERMQKLGQRFALENTFGVVASGRLG